MDGKNGKKFNHSPRNACHKPLNPIRRFMMQGTDTVRSSGSTNDSGDILTLVGARHLKNWRTSWRAYIRSWSYEVHFVSLFLLETIFAGWYFLFWLLFCSLVLAPSNGSLFPVLLNCLSVQLGKKKVGQKYNCQNENHHHRRSLPHCHSVRHNRMVSVKPIIRFWAIEWAIFGRSYAKHGVDQRSNLTIRPSDRLSRF